MEGGYDKKRALFNPNSASYSIEKMLLDPEFWKCLGKALHQDDFKNEENGKGSWKSNWHFFIDHIAYGGDTESFFNNLNL